jgi:hypothetical protein
MARKKERHEAPVPSNRGRQDARGVFVIFEDDGEPESDAGEQDARRPAAEGRDGGADQPLTRERR